MNIKKSLKTIKFKVKRFLKDNLGAPIWEYILLIGFALFIFFIVVSIVISTLEWVTGLTDSFSDTVGGTEDRIILISAFLLPYSIPYKIGNSNKGV